jgi:hypothetical protein
LKSFLAGQQQQQQQLQQKKGLAQRVIVHLDMDCFFAAVAAVGRPEFAGELWQLRVQCVQLCRN